ncbi:1-phosphofructokinase [Tistrella mobilis]|uniref:1-phosphofructokinase n=1 Tax=Tistrella mobilis TaxID=171437 RepID=UPI0035567B45
MTAAIITVTLNPAIDQTIVIDHLVPGEVHRAKRVECSPGGKGVNVASCLADWGLRVTATGILGRDNAAAFDGLFAAGRIADRFLRVPGETRVNVKLADLAAADTTDINLPGLAVGAADLGRLRTVLDEVAGAGSVVVLAGSLPSGVAVGIYPDLCRRLRTRGARVVLDTSGAPLAAALGADEDALPDCVKPNRDELAAWAGRRLETRADLLAAAQGLVARGIALVVVSMGAEGALFVTATRAIHAGLPPERVLSTVGAGDAMVAGIVAAHAEGGDLERIARAGTAFAATKLGLVGPHLPARGVVEAAMARVHLAETDIADRLQVRN